MVHKKSVEGLKRSSIHITDMITSNIVFQPKWGRKPQKFPLQLTFAKNDVPFLVAKVGYFLCKNDASSLIASSMVLLSLISCCDRLITPIIPSFTGITLPQRISIASVPTIIN